MATAPPFYFHSIPLLNFGRFGLRARLSLPSAFQRQVSPFQPPLCELILGCSFPFSPEHSVGVTFQDLFTNPTWLHISYSQLTNYKKILHESSSDHLHHFLIFGMRCLISQSTLFPPAVWGLRALYQDYCAAICSSVVPQSRLYRFFTDMFQNSQQRCAHGKFADVPGLQGSHADFSLRRGSVFTRAAW